MSAAAAGAAAAAIRRQMEAEEEAMTPYTPADLDEDWEFKIVRSATSAFRDRATLQRLIEEEARAGWVMLEKFDDRRVRFKRRRSARANDAGLPADYDPYRTRLGISDTALALVIVGATILLLAVVLAVARLEQ